MVKGSIVSSAARPARIGRFEGSGSFSRLARVAGLTLKQPTVYFLAPLPQWIFSGRELIAWSNMMELSVYGTWSGLPNEIASELFANATFYQLKAGDTLFQTGDKGDGCYRLDLSLLKVSLISPQVRERIIAIITPGVVVGDLAVIDGLPRSASVHALTDCELRFPQPSRLRAPRSRPPRNPSIPCEAVGRSVATSGRDHRILGFLACESPCRLCPACAS